jgi:hypothetical protein
MKRGACANRHPGMPRGVRLEVRTPWLHHGNVGSSPAPRTIISGSVTALTAADPDHNRGGKPTVMTAKRNVAIFPQNCQRSGPALPHRDGVSRHERLEPRQAN